MIWIATIYLLMNTMPYLFNNDVLYYCLNSGFQLFIVAFLFDKIDKKVSNLVFCFIIMLMSFYDFVDYSILMFADLPHGFYNYLLSFVLFLFCYIIVFKNRYNWEKQKSDQYNPNIVQAIYSKPKGLLTLFGATISFSPRCSVRYTYQGQTVRFKKGKDYPVMMKTFTKNSDIIKDTIYSGNYFKQRCEFIKNKKYNLLKFNCKHLMK